MDLFKTEVAQFLYYLQHRELSTKSESRMWFRNDLLITDALRKIIQYNRSKVEIEILNIISEIVQIKELDNYRFCIGDMMNMLSLRQLKIDGGQVRKILQNKWELQPEPPTYYTAYYISYEDEILEKKKTSRIYTVSKELLNRLLL